MAEVPGSMLTGQHFVAGFFCFHVVKACDANIAIIANFGYFVKKKLVSFGG